MRAKKSIDELVENMTVNLTPEQKNTAAQLFLFGFHNWNGEGLLLIPLHFYEKIPDGTELTCIDGKKAVKGKDYIDGDTRGGAIAFGILPHQYQEIFDIVDE